MLAAWCVQLLCAAEAIRTGDFVYIVSKTGAALTRYLGDAERVEVPRRLSGVPVTVIGENAFAQNAALRAAVLPPSVVEIRSGAFASCPLLEYIVMPDSVRRIGKSVCAPNVVIIAEQDSFAYTFAEENGLTVRTPIQQ